MAPTSPMSISKSGTATAKITGNKKKNCQVFGVYITVIYMYDCSKVVLSLINRADCICINIFSRLAKQLVFVGITKT